MGDSTCSSRTSDDEGVLVFFHKQTCVVGSSVGICGAKSRRDNQTEGRLPIRFKNEMRVHTLHEHRYGFPLRQFNRRSFLRWVSRLHM